MKFASIVLCLMVAGSHAIAKKRNEPIESLPRIPISVSLEYLELSSFYGDQMNLVGDPGFQALAGEITEFNKTGGDAVLRERLSAAKVLFSALQIDTTLDSHPEIKSILKNYFVRPDSFMSSSKLDQLSTFIRALKYASMKK